MQGDVITNSIRYLQRCDGYMPDVHHLDQSNDDIHTCIYIHIHIPIYIYIYTYTYIYIHTYVYTYMQGDVITNSIRYLQRCEGYRPDVQHLDQSMMTYAWFKIKQERHFKDIIFPNSIYNPYKV